MTLLYANMRILTPYKRTTLYIDIFNNYHTKKHEYSDNNKECL